MFPVFGVVEDPEVVAGRNENKSSIDGVAAEESVVGGVPEMGAESAEGEAGKSISMPGFVGADVHSSSGRVGCDFGMVSRRFGSTSVFRGSPVEGLASAAEAYSEYI